jgi:hypothetical protein
VTGQRDKADELRTVDDLWPLIEQQLPIALRDAKRHLDAFIRDQADLTHAPTYKRALEMKFAAGEAEHGRDWLNMTRDQLLREIYAEVLDLVLYAAMIRTRWVRTAPAFETNRDPGDEADA